ncbi:acyl carrier protein [Thioalkalivibrio denitrificans]|uniref:Acyl carrier protein n=1 Tax=Thioalkalivibrio denitrificans TaxID=108003 RepID=A0A1V3NCE3_9GAMM|nr:phosphopantetheine-binding protein [Thioalkalivibrio denitrificans]OOG22750.1 acyl carrier protein [Thioalkalivibrio denitrificans]
MSTLQEVRTLLDRALGLGGRAEKFDAETPLLGSLPELDSMAVVALITAIEEHYGIMVEDDEVDAETFETLGSLVAFVESKLA